MKKEIPEIPTFSINGYDLVVDDKDWEIADDILEMAERYVEGMYGSDSAYQIERAVEGMLIRGVWDGDVKRKNSMQPKDRLIFALDVPNVAEASSLLNKLEGRRTCGSNHAEA
jgi:hypothetical protein